MPQKKSYKSPVPSQGHKPPADGLEKWTDITSIDKYVPQAVGYWNTLQKELSNLKKILFSWSITSQQFMPLNQRDILADWLRCYHQYKQFDQFDVEFNPIKDFFSNMERVKNFQLIYKSYNIFRKLKWEVRFDDKFVSKFVQCSLQKMKYIMAVVMMLADGLFMYKKDVTGQFGYARAIPANAFPFNRFFQVKAFREKNFLVHIGVQKLPIVTRGNVIKRYEFKSFVSFLDILGDPIVENAKKLQQRVKFALQKIRQDVARRDHGQQLQIEPQKFANRYKYFFYEEPNPYNTIREVFETNFAPESSHRSAVEPWWPTVFKVYYVSSTETSALVFNKTMKRWISQDYLDRVERKKLNEYQRKINEEMVKRFVDFQSAKSLVELLTKIPNFKVKLTNQEKDVIGENGNVMVIGRSGTGKTTCAVLRLFSIEMLFKIRLSLYKKKFSSEISNTRCSSDDIDQAIGLHCIFLTASPVLTNEIQRYYKKLTDNIKEELEKKKKRVQEERKRQEQETIQEEENENDDSKVEEVEAPTELKEQKSSETEEMKEKQEEFQKVEDQNSELPETLQRAKSKQVIQEQTEMNQQLKDIQLKEDVQNEQFNQDEEDFDKAKQQFEQKLKKYHSLEDLTEKDYPGFFTVKSYIMMLDGTLKKPFFIRGKGSNEILEQESIKAAWHNERKGVMMIENYYKNQGAEDNEDEINEKMLNEIEEEINYSDEEELEHEYMRQIQLRANQDKQKLTKKLAAKKKKNLMSFEVDYEFFLTHFWPNVNRKFYSSRNITPQLVWTEIYSTIKGNASSHLFPGLYLSEKAYLSVTQNVFLTQNEKLDIYQTFCQYERWKIKAGGYDIMDAVNYILNYIRFRGHSGPEIHYMMIDEVQDLPHAIIYLLSKTAMHGVFYSGDTAQTIAKGVGFRFCDLKSLFDPVNIDFSLNLKKPIVKHLTVNFRSHNNILQLANSIVSSMEILFPKTIDKLAKERSDLEGPKPMILAENDEEMLFYVLCGDQKAKNANEGDAMKKPPLDFGCDQVIIVRDQESKDKIPNMLQHALCLTIYEAKGLEFNDVILFNFFTECKHPEKWSLLKYLKVVEQEISKEQYDRNLTRHNQEEEKPEAKKEEEKEKEKEKEPEEVWVDSECIVEQADQTIKLKKIVSDVKKIMKDINDFAELCSDLKLLYTAITRPRKTLIIYDEDPACRKIIEKMWENLGIIQIVTKQLIENEAYNDESNTSIFTKVIQATDSNEWKKQGLKMYARGYFEQAMKCFEKSRNQELYKKAHANLLADRATKMLITVESDRNSIKQGFVGFSDLSAPQMAKLKKKIKHNQATSFTIFNEAAKIFESMEMHKQAGQCYFSGRKFEQAKDCFMKAKMIKQAGQSYEMLKQYDKAAQMYDQEGDYLKVIECLDMVNEWEEILKVIKKYESGMSELEKSSLLKKYASLALEQLVYEIEFENDQQIDKEKRPENNRIQVIQEKQSDEEEDDEDSDEESSIQETDPEKEAEESYKQKNKAIIETEQPVAEKQPTQMLQTVYEPLEVAEKSLDGQSFSDLNQTAKDDHKETEQKKDQIDEKMLQTVKDQSFSDLNDSLSPVEIQKIEEKPSNNHAKKKEPQTLKEADSSFSDLNQSDDFSDLNAKYEKQLQPDIESIKSLADPEDPWIRSVMSLSEINPKSEYSMVDQSEDYNMNVKIIKTKGNIFIQDQIMEKIIRIVSIINSSSTTFLQQFKGYQSLITLNKTEGQQNQIECAEITDFEDIDSETINVILDTLESFKLYKLCLFVCNRYHLPEKAGRYLVSIMMKYSTNCQTNALVSSGLLAPSSQRKTELEKGILGSIAVHSILENVNSEFLKIKISSNEDQNRRKNSLGTYFIQGLILEGFYKKTVFITNPEESLHILDNFCDYELFRQVCRNKFLKNQGEELFLEKVPKNDIQTKFSLISLREIIAKYQVANRLDMISYRYYKEFGFYDKVNFFKELKVPQYLPFMKHIMGHDEKLSAFLDKQLPATYNVLVRGNELETADAVLGMLCVMNNDHLAKELFENCSLKTFLEFYRCIKHIRNVIYHLDGLNSLNILRPILTFYQCKLIENYKSMSFLGSGYCFLNRTSNLANELIEEAKTQPQMFAFFFEQDFNYIMVKISTVMKIIKKKFNVRLSKFLSRRTGLQRFKRTLLPDDYLLHNQEKILVDALKEAVSELNKGQRKPSKDLNKSKPKQKISRTGIDFKTRGKMQHAYIVNEYDLSEDEQQTRNEVFSRDNYVLPIFSPEMSYLADQMLSIFNRQVKSSKDIVMGRQLYCTNLNSYYREYVEKIGGFNLYEAIEFKKFRRVDLYADNILSVIDSFPVVDKHIFTAEILILLLVEYKRLTEKGKTFRLDIDNDYLKFFEELKVVQCIGEDNNEKKEYENLNSDDLHQSIAIDNKRFRFAYNNAYCGDLTAKELTEVICDYLDILIGEESSQFVDFASICKMYLLNITPNPQNTTLYQKLRKAVNTLGHAWDKSVSFYTEMIKTKNLESFVAARENVLMRVSKIPHQITVTCTGNIDEVIAESERDYEIQTRIINGRKKALKKIISWWKSTKPTFKQKSEKSIVNYFDHMLKNQNPAIENSTNQLYKSINDFRMFEKLYDCNLTLNVPLILTIEKTREDLLKFYLKHIVTSSLDFHYILMTLRKIEGLTQQYTSLCKELQTGIVETDVNTAVSSLWQGINDIQSNINTWKTDEKWLREKNLAFKKKKVFQVKWMTKSLNQMKIIRKRAGLKKQEKLQLKKRLLKN